MRTIIWFLYFAIYLIVVLPKIYYIKFLQKRGKTEKSAQMFDTAVSNWARRLLKLAGVTVVVKGKENLPTEPCVFVSNHQGNFDIPILLVNLDKPHGFIAKVETKKIPVIRTCMELLQCVFLDRKDARSAVSSINEASVILKEGHSIIIFPEGTRSRGPEMGEFKLGAFSIAGKAKVPVVPMRIEGSYKAMEANGMWIKPTTVVLTILPAVSTDGKTKKEMKVLGEEMYQLIQGTQEGENANEE